MDVGDTSFVGNSGANNLHHINDVSESKNASSKTCDRYSRRVKFQQKFASFFAVKHCDSIEPGNSSLLSRETRGGCKKHAPLLGVNCRIVHLLLQKLSFSENLRKHIHTITAITNFLKTALFPPHASQLYECQVYISHTNYDTAWGLKVEITSSWSPFSSLIPTSPTHALWTIDFQSPPNSFYILSWGEFLLWVSIHHSTFYPLPPSACVPHVCSVRSPRAVPAHGSDGDRRRGHPPLAGAAGGLLPGQRVNVRAANGPGLRGHAYATAAAGTGVTSPPASFFAPAHISLFQSVFFSLTCFGPISNAHVPTPTYFRILAPAAHAGTVGGGDEQCRDGANGAATHVNDAAACSSSPSSCTIDRRRSHGNLGSFSSLSLSLSSFFSPSLSTSSPSTN